MKLLESRRFWLLVLDTIISLALHFWGAEDVKFLITALQPIFVLVIIAYTVDDTVAKFRK